MRTEQNEVEAKIFLRDCWIEGMVHLPQGGRLTDYLALAERQFIPVTNARVFRYPGDELLHEVAFLNVNKNSIQYIFPKLEQTK